MAERVIAESPQGPGEGSSPLSGTLTLSQLEQHLWAAANILRGPIDQGDFKSYIFPLLFFKRICDVYDEEFADALEESDGDLDYAAFAENHRFQIPTGSHWNDVREKPENLGLAAPPWAPEAGHNAEALRAPMEVPRGTTQSDWGAA
jgi:type I restriction-modification system DNA methylase subunit